MSVVDRSYDHELKLEERAAYPLAGGVLQQGYQCGMLWGAALAAGARAYQLYGAGTQAQAEALRASQRLVETFRARNHAIDCADITEIEWKNESQRNPLVNASKFILKGGPILCFRTAAWYARATYNVIEAVFSQPPGTPVEPVSCTVVLAQRMGVSELQVVMAAGLAGGIGLSGGGCGALGAAIWILGIRSGMPATDKMSFKVPGADETLGRFVKSANYEFECAKITGRRFESAAEHAEYVCAGGCSQLIEVLATQ